VSTFPVTAWFDNDTIPEWFGTANSWDWEDTRIQIDFRKAE
jgi:hypothetical protein